MNRDEDAIRRYIHARGEDEHSDAWRETAFIGGWMVYATPRGGRGALRVRRPLAARAPQAGGGAGAGHAARLRDVPRAAADADRRVLASIRLIRLAASARQRRRLAGNGARRALSSSTGIRPRGSELRAGAPPIRGGCRLAPSELGGPAQVVDVGAGTGKLSAQLVQRDVAVLAVEPVAAMRDRRLCARPSGHSSGRHGGDPSARRLIIGRAPRGAIAPLRRTFRRARRVDRVLHPTGAVETDLELPRRRRPLAARLDVVLTQLRGDAPHSRRPPLATRRGGPAASEGWSINFALRNRGVSSSGLSSRGRLAERAPRRFPAAIGDRPSRHTDVAAVARPLTTCEREHERADASRGRRSAAEVPRRFATTAPGSHQRNASPPSRLKWPLSTKNAQADRRRGNEARLAKSAMNDLVGTRTRG